MVKSGRHRSECASSFTSLKFALRLLLIGVVGAERVEACFLLVVERLIELLDHGPYRAHRLQHGIEALAHGLDPPRRRARQRAVASLSSSSTARWVSFGSTVCAMRQHSPRHSRRKVQPRHKCRHSRARKRRTCFPSSMLYALKTQVGLTLDRLTRRKGPERQVSLSWLVWEACDLWTRETGEPVTNSAVRNDDYTGSPESPAERFVLSSKPCSPPNLG